MIIRNHEIKGTIDGLPRIIEVLGIREIIVYLRIIVVGTNGIDPDLDAQVKFGHEVLL